MPLKRRASHRTLSHGSIEGQEVPAPTNSPSPQRAHGAISLNSHEGSFTTFDERSQLAGVNHLASAACSAADSQIEDDA